ncbi:hypothetical protein [Intestinibaculum porci]|jgi:signal recognition particle subunit SEC65|nr:hypothetical protein [Intestinibaculum porci]MDD6349735.1 hypothetical protein [Intestinibaculum porci]MDD6421455.1 hypothetical protein [Intestinibaculum porci]
MMEDPDYKRLVVNKCKYFNMREVCEKAGINYSTYRGWKNNGRSFSDEKAKILFLTMKEICEKSQK